MPKPPLTLYLAAPRGFCAGVDRAIKIVELALEKWGAPVYVRHEIVHNRHVVDGLRAKGAVFVEELDECPPDRPVIFSAHGVPKSVPEQALARNLIHVDATCPLVTKVHIEAARHAENGLQMVMIGHAGHPETVGTMGQLPPGEVLLVETVADVASITVRDPAKLAFVTQTTLSVDDTADIVAALQARFPAIIGPHKEDICYATTNRQEAVKAMAPLCDAMLVVGAPNSSNSRRLVEVGAKAGCPYAQLIQSAAEIDWRALDGIRSIGITAGASAPEDLIAEVIAAFHARYDVTEEKVVTAEENVEFKVPPHPARACMTWVEFDGRIETITWGKASYTILPLPDDVVAALGPTKRVEGEIDEHPVNLAITRAPPVDGAFLCAGQSLLDRVGAVPGQVVAARLRPAPDDAVDVAPDVAAALLAGGVSAAWGALTPGKQRGLLYQIDTAKTAPTRAKRIAALVARLLAGD